MKPANKMETKMNLFLGKTLKTNLTIDTFVPSYGFGMGETFYVVCDHIGSIFTTIYPRELERFYEEAK